MNEKSLPPLPGEKGYNPQRMTIHRPKSGRRGPLPIPAPKPCKSVSPDPRFGRCALEAGHEDAHEPIWGNTWTTEEQAN